MALTVTTDTAIVLRLAQGAVAADPVRNTVFGSIAFGVQQPDAAPWAAWPAGHPTVLAARSQPHTPVSVTAGWTRLGPLVEALRRLDPPPAGIAGPTGAVDPLTLALGYEITDRMDERLFRLDALIDPAGVPGAARPAATEDVGFLAEWYAAFTVEAFGRLPPGFDARAMVERGIVRARCWIWSDAAGVPRSMAVRHPAVSGAARIGPVYSPPAGRGHGYGSAATAAAAADILAEGAVPCLFTDLANPTSNRVYRRLGFRPVLDRTLVRFD